MQIPDSYLPPFLRRSAQTDDAVDEAGPRLPRRLARLISLEGAVEAFIDDHLDRIDRKAPLDGATVAGVNELLRAAARPLARTAGGLVTPPFSLATPVRPGEAFIALLRVRVGLGEILTAQLKALEADDAPAA